MIKSPGISLYNQDRFGDPEFVANFVARNALVEALLASLRHIAEGGPTEHQMLVGARGMGKTSLLRRIAIGIIDDPHLKAAFIPLRFREEQYNIISLDAFWRNCGESLAEYCEQQGNQALADQLDIAIESPEWRDANHARDAFLAACDQAGGRAILLLDNLDLILEGIKAEGCWSLRNALQKPQGPIVIGAATQLLAQGGDRKAAFYEFFNPHMLEPLSERELLACLNALADLRGPAGASVKAILAREPERVRALYVLTGGNPRVLALVYQLLEQADSETIFADLEALLDQLTPFYKARIEEYQTPLQRAVIDGIALNWDPITSAALVRETGVEATTLSGQLNRLKRDGLIEEVETSGTRSGYQLAERFLNIWYLMRHGTRKTKQRLRWFTIFLTKLFSADELQRMAGDARQGAGGKWNADHCDAVIEAYELKLQNEAFELRSAADELFSAALELQEAGSSEDAIAIYDEIVVRFGASDAADLQLRVAMALVNKGFTLGTLGRSGDEIAVYDEVVERFGESDTAGLRWQVAMALGNKGATLQRLGRSEDLISVCDEVVARFATSNTADLQLRVAMALRGKGFALDTLDRSEDAVAAYQEVVMRFGATEAADLQRQVARAQVKIGTVLFWDFGRDQEGLSALLQAIKADPSDLFAKANLIWIHIARGQLDEANALSEELHELTDGGRSLMLAGLDLAADNLGSSLAQLSQALDQGLSGEFDYAEDLIWYLRIAVERGYGERLIDWFGESGNADRFAPVYGALVAYVRGERFLLDINPEVRGVAKPLFAKLSAGKRHRKPVAETKGPKRKR